MAVIAACVGKFHEVGISSLSREVWLQRLSRASLVIGARMEGGSDTFTLLAYH